MILGPHETIMYTWDDPAGTRSLWWSVVGNLEKCNKPISLSKVHREDITLQYHVRSCESFNIVINRTVMVLSSYPLDLKQIQIFYKCKICHGQ